MSVAQQRWRACGTCGERAEFTVQLPALSAPKKERLKEVSIPLVWQCRCGAATPLVLQKHEAA